MMSDPDERQPAFRWFEEWVGRYTIRTYEDEGHWQTVVTSSEALDKGVTSLGVPFGEVVRFEEYQAEDDAMAGHLRMIETLRQQLSDEARSA